MALDRPFKRVSAPAVLDRAEVLAYADRVDTGITDLWNAMAGYGIKWASTDKPKLPSEFVSSYRNFVESWKEFYESIKSFNLFGPTVWSAWDTVEGYESQLKAYREKFVSLGGEIKTPSPVTPAQVAKEHPGGGLGFLDNIPLFLGIGVAVAAVVLVRPYLPTPTTKSALTEKKNVPV